MSRARDPPEQATMSCKLLVGRCPLGGATAGRGKKGL